ncbi:MAG: GNAT family N-acetyltransferase [Methanoregula sp.]|jgi:GNAT superfamily N-acetyltransferase|uniref:GNAT family N-acetyltransferase n=1 Tax=Methanoregula sp. TaxID=2052170 RepID=UPI003D097F2A
MTGEAGARELGSDEFGLAEKLWEDYHQTKGDPSIDRVFGVFSGNALVSVARCRRHPDGYEVDGVFTPEDRRGHGYAKAAVAALVEACHHDLLYMHAVLGLVPFYQEFGFEPIDENELPPSIKARFAFALGEMEGSNVRPMRRGPGLKLAEFRELLEGSGRRRN